MPEPLTIEEGAPCGVATVMARNGVTAQAVAEALETAAVDGPRWTTAGDFDLLGSGPGVWLAVGGDPAALAARLREALGELASVSDQSGAYVLFRLAGAGARTVLQRGAPVDLHPEVFRPGSVATTAIAHVGVVIRLLDEAPTFEAAVFRSYAGAFRHWLGQAAAAL